MRPGTCSSYRSRSRSRTEARPSRPVLALTPPDQNGDFIACPITSRSHWTTARRLLPEHVDRGGLPLPSSVRTDRMVTLHIGVVVKSFGHAIEAFRAEVAADLRGYFRATQQTA